MHPDDPELTQPVATLVPAIHVDCRTRLSAFIAQGKTSMPFGEVDWSANEWNVTAAYQASQRPHDRDRKVLRINFFMDKVKHQKSSTPLPEKFAELVKAVVCLRYERLGQCRNNQQTFIDAVAFLAKPLKKYDYDVTRVTRADFEAAAQGLKGHVSPSTFYVQKKFLTEFADTLDTHGLTPVRLNFKCRGGRPITHGGLKHKHLDEVVPGRALGGDENWEAQLQALGLLYHAVPEEHTGDAILVRASHLLPMLARRVGELLSLAAQPVSRDRNGNAYLVYFPEKRSHGSQIVTAEILYLIPQWVPHIERLVNEILLLSAPARAVQQQIEAKERIDDAGLPAGELISGADLAQWLGRSPGDTAHWARKRDVPVVETIDGLAYYERAAIVKAAQAEMITQPIFHVASGGRDIYLSELLLMTFKSGFRYSKPPLPYCAEPMHRQHISDFLGNNLDRTSGFARYLSPDRHVRIPTHWPRHLVNDALDRGGMSDELQTRWFGRKHAPDTKAYQHAAPEEKVRWALDRLIREGLSPADAEQVEETPTPYTAALAVADSFAIHDVGFGWCQHDWRQAPCPKPVALPLANGGIPGETMTRPAIQDELVRQRRMLKKSLQVAQARDKSGLAMDAQWLEAISTRLKRLEEFIGRNFGPLSLLED